MYYLVSSEYVGANESDSSGNIIGDSETITITTTSPITNMSGEVLTHGWLGTTNDWASYAKGEYDSLELALAELKELGFTYQVDTDDVTDGDVSVWQRPEAALEKWSAGDWLGNAMSNEEICTEYKISANTSDDQLVKISDKIDKDAENDGIKLFGSMDLLVEIRAELKD